MNEEYYDLQQIVHEMFESLPVLNSKDINQPAKLQKQACAYIRKILSMFEKYSGIVKKNESLAKFCGIPQATEGAIKMHIQQLQSKVEYLSQQLEDAILEARSTKQTDMLQKQLKHEQSIKKELQDVIDKLMLDLKDSKSQSNKKKSNESEINVIKLEKLSVSLQTHLSELQCSISNFLQEIYQKFKGNIKFDDWNLSNDSYCTENIDSINKYFSNEIIQMTEQIKSFSGQTIIAIDIWENEKMTEKNSIQKNTNKEIIRLQERLAEMEHQIQLQFEKEKVLTSESDDFIQHILLQQEDLNKKLWNITKNGVKGQGLENLIENDKLFERITGFQKILKEFRKDKSQTNISFNSQNSSFKERLRQDQLELKQKIKHSIGQLEQEKKKEDDQRLSKEIERNQLLNKKYEKNNIVIAKLLIYIDESVNRASYFVDQLQYKVESEECQKLTINIQQQLTDLQTSAQQLKPHENLSVNQEMQNEYIRQKQMWIQLIEEEQQIINELNKQVQNNQELHKNICQLQSQLEQEKQINDSFEDQHRKLSDENKSLHSTLIQWEDDKKQLMSENNAYRIQIQKIESDFNGLITSRGQFENTFEKEKNLLKNMLEEWKSKYDTLKQSNDQLKTSYFEHMNQIKQESEKLQRQFNLKCQETEALNNTLIDLEEFSKKQLDLIKAYEKQEYENSYLKTDEKIEITKYRNQYEEATRQNKELESKINSLQKEYLQVNEKIMKQTEIIQILREEIKNLKSAINRKNQEIYQKDQEFSEICNELYSQIGDLQNKLKESSQQGQQENDLIEENQQLNQQIYLLQEQLAYFEQKTNSSQQNQNQFNQEVQQLKRELRKMGHLLDTEREKNNENVTTLLEFQKKQQQLQEMEKQKLKNSSASKKEEMTSAFYENLVEAKDLEIQRLTGIIKNLSSIGS